MPNPLGAVMKCGHSAQGTVEQDGKQIPACIICLGQNPAALEKDEVAPDLHGRKARCDQWGEIPGGENHSPLNPSKCRRGEPCMCEEPSEKALAGGLPFFSHLPHATFDRYYCGCRGFE